MKNDYLILLFVFLPFLVFSQHKKDVKRYEKISSLIEKNQLDEAEVQVQILLEKTNYKWKKPYLLKALIYKKKGKILESAYEYLKVYDSTNRTHAEPFFNIAELLYGHAYYSEALRIFRISSDLSNESDRCLRYIQNCLFSIESIKNPKEFNPENLGSFINSDRAEYLPNISADGKILIITRRDTFQDFLQEDLFYSHRNDEEWGTLSPFSMNSYLMNEGSATISADQRFLVYTLCETEYSNELYDGFGSCDLYLSVKDDNGFWSNPKNLGSIINTRYWESQPCFSPDGEYLYFVSNRRGGFGQDDIWRSKITKFGFSNPENLGPLINTKYNEMSPFIHPDNLTFYFASEGHIGMGGFDLFISRRKDTEDNWYKPNNLGYPINSHKIENSLVVSPDGKTAFFASDQSGFGEEDIFSFQLSEMNRANQISDLEIDIITKTEGSEIVLHNVFFETDSYILKESSFKELNILLYYLQKYPLLKIQIEGHTDNVGRKEYNQTLSEKRAKEVYNYLLIQGVLEERLFYKGYGESNPIAENSSKEGREMNRRTSFIIIE